MAAAKAMSHPVMDAVGLAEAGAPRVTAMVKPGRLLSERRGTAIALSLVFLISGGILSYGLTRPWIGHHDYNGAWTEAGANVRVFGLILLLFTIAALPRIYGLHRPEHAADYVAEGLMVKQHTHSGELVATNEEHWLPNYYSDRDFRTVLTVSELEQAIQRRAPRPMVFVLLEYGPGAQELGAWLSTRYPSQEVTLPAKHPKQYRIFELSDVH